jgi:hypothetical protein
MRCRLGGLPEVPLEESAEGAPRRVAGRRHGLLGEAAAPLERPARQPGLGANRPRQIVAVVVEKGRLSK